MPQYPKYKSKEFFSLSSRYLCLLDSLYSRIFNLSHPNLSNINPYINHIYIFNFNTIPYIILLKNKLEIDYW
ncbi:hypothetical protein SNUCP3_04970 [Clostridium perfringens A]